MRDITAKDGKERARKNVSENFKTTASDKTSMPADHSVLDQNVQAGIDTVSVGDEAGHLAKMKMF